METCIFEGASSFIPPGIHPFAWCNR